MSNTWLIIALVVLVAAGAVLVLYRKRQANQGVVLGDPGTDAARNYTQDREDARLAGMSAEDRAWETASLQRQQAQSAAADPLAEPRT